MRAGKARRADRRTGAFARDVALAALVLGALSGMALAAFFDPDAPYRSISAWLLAQPVASFTRNVHSGPRRCASPRRCGTHGRACATGPPRGA